MSSRSKQNQIKAYNISLKYLSTRIRSIKEIRDYLYKKKFSNDIISQTLLILEKEKLVDDRAFALEFVFTREKLRPKSKFALQYELYKKGISDPIIEEAIAGINEYKSALTAVELKFSTWLLFDKNKIKKKILNFLKNRGFNYEVSLATYEKVSNRLQNYGKNPEGNMEDN